MVAPSLFQSILTFSARHEADEKIPTTSLPLAAVLSEIRSAPELGILEQPGKPLAQQPAAWNEAAGCWARATRSGSGQGTEVPAT